MRSRGAVQGAIVKVLAIDDNQDDVLLLCETLVEGEGAGFELECVDRLATGLQLVGNGGVDVVLLDLELPDSQGLETLDRVRTAAPALPIIVLTDQDKEAIAIQAVERGAQDYLVRGQVDSKLVERTIRYAIERKGAVEALREGELCKGAIVESALDCIVVMDHQGRIIEFNPAAERTFGYNRAEVIGQQMAERLIPPGLRDRHHRALSRYLATGERSVLGRRVEMTAMRADGAEFPIELTITDIHSGRGPVFIGFIRDVTERKQAEQRLAAQHVVTRVLAESATVAAAGPRILQAICGGLGWDVGEIWSMDRDANVLRCAEIWHPPSDDLSAFAALTRQMSFARGIGLPGRVWATGTSAWVADVVEDANFLRSAIAAKEGLHGAFAFPILFGTDILGVIAFYSRRIRQPDEHLLRMLDDIANQVGQFIARKRTEETLSESEEKYRSLVANIPSVTWTSDREGKTNFISPNVEAVYGYTPEEIYRAGEDLWFGNIHPDDVEQVRRQYQLLFTAKGRFDIQYRIQRKDGQWIWIHDRAVAMYEKDGVTYAYGVFSDVTKRKRMDETLRALYQASLQIQESAGLRERLDRLLQTARTVLELDRVNILLAEPDGQWLQAVASLGTREPVEALRIPIGPAGGGIARTYRTQQVVTWDGTGLVPEELRLKPPYDRIEAFRSRVFANVPLVVQGRAIGVLGADRKHTQRPLDPATLELLQLFAAQVALAIEHGRLYEAQRMAALQLEAKVEERTQQLKDAMQRIEEASHHKSEFLASMSHELRTPLNAVIGFAELLEKERHGPLTGKQARFVQHVLSSGRHLLQIVNDLLDLSKIETGRIELRLAPIRLEDLLEEARTLVSAQAASKSHTLSLRVEEGLPVIEADPLRLKQVLVNLLSNAVTFTPAGGAITVTARRVDTEQFTDHRPPSKPCRGVVGGVVEISVADTGIGIRPEDAGRLFQEFVQLDRFLDEPRQGTGLGLAITKKLVELHGGQIWAASDGSGRGSTFTVRLPL